MQSSRGTSIKISQIKALIDDYDTNKRAWRAWTGDTEGMKDLRAFFNDKLKLKAAQALAQMSALTVDYPLDDEDVQGLITLLNKRFWRVSRYTFGKDYRSDEADGDAQKLTNKEYRALAQLVASYLPDQKETILAYVQFYKNDYRRKGLTLFHQADNKPREKIFVTKANYAIPYSDLIEEIKANGFGTYTVYGKDGENIATVSFYDEDIQKLYAVSEIRNHADVKAIFDLHEGRYIKTTSPTL